LTLEDKEIVKVLKFILERINGKEMTWRLEGSTNLRVQGVDVPVNDVDLTTDSEGYAVFKEAFKEFVVADRRVEEKKEQSLLCRIEGADVEILCYDQKELNMFDRVNGMVWQGMELPALPLAHAKRFYQMIGRQDKVDIINKHTTA
jgi:hypothetical protein